MSAPDCTTPCLPLPRACLSLTLRAAPVVLLSEVPIIRVESESDNDSYVESPRQGPMDRPVVHTGASSGRRSIEFREPETEAFRQGGPESGSGGVRLGQGPAAGTAVRGDDAYSNQEDDDGRVLAGRPGGVVKLPKRSGEWGKNSCVGGGLIALRTHARHVCGRGAGIPDWGGARED